MSTMTFPHFASHSGLITLAQIRLRADGLMLLLTWLLWLIALGVGWHHDAIALALVVGGALTVAATGVKLLFAGRLLSRLWFAFTLMAFAALLIQLGHGETEYHFSVFVLLSALLAGRERDPRAYRRLGGAHQRRRGAGGAGRRDHARDDPQHRQSAAVYRRSVPDERSAAQTLSVAEDQQQQTRSLQEAIALFRFA